MFGGSGFEKVLGWGDAEYGLRFKAVHTFERKGEVFAVWVEQKVGLFSLLVQVFRHFLYLSAGFLPVGDPKSQSKTSEMPQHNASVHP